MWILTFYSLNFYRLDKCTGTQTIFIFFFVFSSQFSSWWLLITCHPFFVVYFVLYRLLFHIVKVYARKSSIASNKFSLFLKWKKHKLFVFNVCVCVSFLFLDIVWTTNEFMTASWILTICTVHPIYRWDGKRLKGRRRKSEIYFY